MEDQSEPSLTIITTAAPTTLQDDKGKKTKKRGALHMIKVALYMLRRRSGGKSNSVHIDKSVWNRLLGAMRLLHLQHHQSPPPSIEGGGSTQMPVSEHFEDVLPPPMSPHGPYSPCFSSSSGDSMSRYASAQNLQELDREGGVGNDDDCDYGGDDMIDAKAEVFIAQFYEQMRLQRLDSINRYNQMMNEMAMI